MKLYISTKVTRNLDREKLLSIEVNLEKPIDKTYYIIESEEEK